MFPWWKNYSQVSPRKIFANIIYYLWVKRSPTGYCKRGVFASFVLSTASWISSFQNFLFNSIHNKHLFKLLTLSKIDDNDNTINNYNIDSAVKQKNSMKSITYHQPHIEFFGLKDVGLISRKKKNEKALYKRKVCQCFFLN